MYETTPIPLPKQAEQILRINLVFYPAYFRKQFAKELAITFADICQEELAKNGALGIRFWLSQIADIAKSILHEHYVYMNRIGIKRYLREVFHVSSYNMIGGLLLLPILLVSSIDLGARIVQRDLVHYNRPLYAFMSHTPLYWYPVLITWVIIFPLLAVLINLIPLIKNITKKHMPILSKRFLMANLISFLVLLVGLGFIALIRLHDFGPCFVHGIFKVGIMQLPRILSVCSRA